MIDSANAIITFITGKNRQQLDSDRLLISGIIRELEILGEASVTVSLETKSKLSDIPWKQLIGMRNRLIHAYFDIDNDIIWKTINEALPPLTEKLKSHLSKSYPGNFPSA